MTERHILPDGTVIEIHGRVHDGMPDFGAAPAAVADPFELRKHRSHDQSSHGNWARGGANVITVDEARGNSRPVTRAEFNRIAAEGKRRYDAMKADRSPPAYLDEHFDEVVEAGWNAVQNEWGGITVDSHTGYFVADGEDSFALTVKDPGQDSVSIPIDADRQLFDAAMVEARRRFDAQLSTPQHHLGVFRDDDTGRIDIDPVLVVGTLDDVETIGAHTHAIGGAYYFADGNGYWPPHVAGSVGAVTKRDRAEGVAAFFAQSRDPERPMFEAPVRKGWMARLFDPFRIAKHASHDQQSHGNWARGGSADDAVIAGSNVDTAAQALGEGKHVQLDELEDVCVLVDKLRDLVADAEAKGEKAPTYDLCKVTVPGSNIFCGDNKGIPRARMPQLKGVPTPGSKADGLTRDERGEVSLNQLFAESLQERGVTIVNTAVPAANLKATQTELNGAKVAGIAKAYREGKLAKERLFVSTDGYIVDGHHRWASVLGVDLEDNVAGDHFMDVAMIDMDILQILDESNRFAAEWGIPQAGMNAGFAKTLLLYNIIAKHASHDQKDHGNWSRRIDSSVSAGPTYTPGGKLRPNSHQPNATYFDTMPEEKRAEILANHAKFGLTPEKMEANLTHLMERIIAERPDLLEAGKTWYDEAHHLIADIGERYGYDKGTAIGIVAAMSPNSDWPQNLATAEHVMKMIAENPTIKFRPEDIEYLTTKGKGDRTGAGARELLAHEGRKLSTLSDDGAAWAMVVLGRQRDLRSETLTLKGEKTKVQWSTGTGMVANAVNMARGGDPNVALNGHKTRSFYSNISDPYNEGGFNDVTIDVHAISATQLYRMPAGSPRVAATFEGPASVPTNQQGAYPLYADTFRTIAAKYDLEPNQAQAALWLGWQAFRVDYGGHSYEKATDTWVEQPLPAHVRERWGVHLGTGEVQHG